MIRSLSFFLAIATMGSGTAHAQATCSASNQFNYNFSSAPTQQLSYGGNFTATASNGLGTNQNVTIQMRQNNLSSTQVAGIQMPRIDVAPISSNTNTRVLNIGGAFSGRTSDINANTRTMRVTFVFPQPVRDFSVRVHDIDYNNNQFRDWINITGSNGSTTYEPDLTSPHGNNNDGTPTAAGSSVQFGPLVYNPPLTRADGVGIGASSNTSSDTGDIFATFPSPVTSVTIRYGNFPFVGSETNTGQQAMGISQFSYCPMPNVSIEKASTPENTTGVQRFNIPGADVIYSFEVRNDGGSPVDSGGLIITDPLPTNATFFAGDYDGGGPGTTPFQLVAGSSGVALPASSLAYSSDGVNFNYTPSVGYDPNVRAIRLTPTGAFAANSSFTVRFRVRIN